MSKAKVQTGGESAWQAIYPGVTEALAVESSAGQSEALGDTTSIVRLCADVPCQVALGDDPEADSDSMYLPANTPEYVLVAPGSKVSVIKAGDDDGTLYITQGA